MAWDGEARTEEGWVFVEFPGWRRGKGGGKTETVDGVLLKQTLTFGRWHLRHEHRFRVSALLATSNGYKMLRSEYIPTAFPYIIEIHTLRTEVMNSQRLSDAK